MTEAARRLLLREYPAALREGHDVNECLVGPADRCTRPGAFGEVLATLIGAMVEVYTDPLARGEEQAWRSRCSPVLISASVGRKSSQRIPPSSEA
jgi:hypothetical protein